jgi:hypothetical protein
MLAVLALGATTVSADTIAQVSRKYRSCGLIPSAQVGYPRAPHVQLEVLSQGRVTCTEAREILHRFHTSRGKTHYSDPRYHDAADEYWIVDGWKCQSGTDYGSGCERDTHDGAFIRHGPVAERELSEQREDECLSRPGYVYDKVGEEEECRREETAAQKPTLLPPASGGPGGGGS